MSDKMNDLFYVFGGDDSPSCPQCAKPMDLTGRRPSTLLGDAYECQKFTCRCGFEIERDADRALNSMTSKTTH